MEITCYAGADDTYQPKGWILTIDFVLHKLLMIEGGPKNIHRALPISK
jgi:hypothetical protein